MAFKGALFLSKSAAAKAAIMKYGSYLLATKGIAATVSTGMTVATAAGYFVVRNYIVLLTYAYQYHLPINL